MKKRSRQIFGGILVAIMVALFAASILYIHAARSSMWNSLTLNALELTKSGAESLSSKLESESASLENLTWILQSCASSDQETIQAVVQGYAREDGTALEAFDLSGGLAYTTAKEGRQTISDAQRTQLASYEDSGWTTPFYSLYDGQRYIGYYARFSFADGAQGVVRKDIDVKTLGESYSLTFYNSQGYSYVVDKNGDIIVRPQDRHSNRTFRNAFDVIGAGSNSKETLQTLRQAVVEGKSGIVYCDFDGEPIVIAFSAIGGTESWSLLSLIPEEAFIAHLDSMLRLSYLVLILLAILVAGSLLYFLYRNQLKQKEQDNLALKETAQKAEAENLAKSQFLSHMSHDIRTPINGIMGMTGIAMKNLGDQARVKDCLHKIDSSSRHLLSLVNDVLDMSRIESGKTQLLCQPFDLRTCLANCSSIIEGQLAGRTIRFQKEFEIFPDPIVMGDELHLQQILINILGNAVKFTPDGKAITFRASHLTREGASVFRFQVEDQGIGMKPEFLPHLFDAFSQEDGGTRTTYKGTGIGMSITKSLVELMGGTIQVASTVNVGTTFTVEIPMELAFAPPPEPAAPEARFHLEGMKVLLAEDNDLNREIAEEILTGEGVAVTSVENGQLALDRYTASPPGTFDAILMDLMMPVMDGLTAARKIRALPRPDAGTIPILAMTANAFEEDVQKTKAAGMNAHLSKPIQVEVLCAALAGVYGQQPAGKGPLSPGAPKET